MKNTPANVAERMAETILALKQARKEYNESDLWLAGFDADEIGNCAAIAYELAATPAPEHYPI